MDKPFIYSIKIQRVFTFEAVPMVTSQTTVGPKNISWNTFRNIGLAKGFIWRHFYGRIGKSNFLRLGVRTSIFLISVPSFLYSVCMCCLTICLTISNDLYYYTSTFGLNYYISLTLVLLTLSFDCYSHYRYYA